MALVEEFRAVLEGQLRLRPVGPDGGPQARDTLDWDRVAGLRIIDRVTVQLGECHTFRVIDAKVALVNSQEPVCGDDTDTLAIH